MTLLDSIAKDIEDQNLVETEFGFVDDTRTSKKALRKHLNHLLSMGEDMCNVIEALEGHLFFDKRLKESDENYDEVIKYVASYRTKKIMKKIKKKIMKLSGASFIEKDEDGEYIVPSVCW